MTDRPHPVSATYLDQQTARASAALPAAGAYDSAPTEMVCPGFEWVTLYLTYTRGAAGGKVKFKLEANPNSSGSPGWAQTALLSPGTVVSGSDTLSLVQQEEVEYGSGGAGAEAFVFGPVRLAGTVERLRVAAAETGVVGTPGTLAIEARYA